MKPVRSLIIFGTGIAAGIAIARRVGADEPEVLHGPSQERSSSNPALRAASAAVVRALLIRELVARRAGRHAHKVPDQHGGA